MDSGLRIIIFGIRSGFETFKNFDIEVLSFKAQRFTVKVLIPSQPIL